MKLAALLLACGCVIDAAVASPSFLDGAYGNAEGCRYAKTGESSGADVFFLLNDEGVTTAASYCQFKSTAKKTSKGFSIRMQCESEGETGDEETVTLEKTKSTYLVRFADGTSWGPLAQCR
ncbi:hypothetical protein ACLE20_06250 [Rhizobium sp. YIM 134829]|uniref:hypothetical protein n=1 Tax=Rhizobium sp. YIM 134829 TaxID=3390453 RepID=UPI00397B90C8